MAVLVGFVCVISASLAASPTADPVELVRQLGEPSFRTREAAARHLRELGAKALDAVRTGCNDADPEIAMWCEVLLPHVRAAAIVADSDGTFGSTVPGAARFRELAGWDHAARQLFAELDCWVFHGRGMKERDFNEFGGWFDPELPGGGHPTKAIDLASFLLETRPVPEFDARVLAAPWLESLLTDGPTAPVLRKLLAARLVAIVSSGHPPHEIYERMHKLRLPECAPLLAKAATDPKVDLHLRAQLIAAVGCLGTEREVAVLVPLVADTKHVTNVHEGGGKVRSTHLGDVALAACLKLSGRDFAEFGMPHVKQALSVLDVHHVGFVTEADRAEALRRWSSATGK